MGTTIEDIYLDEIAEQDYFEEKIEEGIKSRKNNYTDEAQKILEYLPINNKDSAEAEYIQHLWDAFATLAGLGEEGAGFSIMPFHLLFMLSLQYRAMRIVKIFERECLLVFSTAGGRDKAKLLNPARSVFDLGCLNERTLPELLQLLNIDGKTLKKIKSKVDYRNDALAHPKGGTVPDYEKKIQEYTDLLEEIQPALLRINDEVAKKWQAEMDSDESWNQYKELHLAEEYLCRADMQQGVLAKLDSRLNEK